MSQFLNPNLPLSEQYAETGDAWADAEAAASLLEDLKSAFLSQRMQAHADMAVNKAEMLVKASADWHEYIEKMVAARKQANRLKVRLESIKMRHMHWTSEQATERTQARL